VLLVAAVIGLSLLLVRDFGESWDILIADLRGRASYDFYFGGFDGERYRSALPANGLFYGPIAELLINIAQNTTANVVQKFEIRTFLQAALSLSALIPIFLISSRVVSKPLALVAVALVAATPCFYGHAFINPKDSIFASGFLWAMYAIVLISEHPAKKSGYVAFLALGACLGLLSSIRYTAIYLLGLVAVALILLPALLPLQSVKPPRGALVSQLWDNTKLYAARLAVLLSAFLVTYIASMPALLIDFQTGTLVDVFRQFAHYPFEGRVLYLGEYISARNLPWHYLFGYMLVKLPLYYHLFFLTMVAGLVVAPSAMVASLKAGLRSDYQRASTVILLFIALIVPLIAVLIVHPVLYDGLRHNLFVLPLIGLLLYFAFLETLAVIPHPARLALCFLAAVFWIEPVWSMARLHPYEYAYYNPLISPADRFELEYWGTSFRELADKLNGYVNVTNGEKLRVSVCGPLHALKTFLDPDRFELVPEEDAQLTVGLNRDGCLEHAPKPWLFTVRRGDLVYAAVGRH
jgi:Dolichyl-phosphate-mannose-protein mannosyltransferase